MHDGLYLSITEYQNLLMVVQFIPLFQHVFEHAGEIQFQGNILFCIVSNLINFSKLDFHISIAFEDSKSKKLNH